jgi:HK97 family phage portal protein
MFDFGATQRAVQVADTFMVSDMLGISDFGRPSERDQREMLRGTFEACVRLRARRFAESVIPSRRGPGLQVQRETADGFEQVEPDHPWLRLIRSPNRYRSGYVFWKWVSLARDLQGRAPQLVQDDDRGMPEELLEIFAEFGRVRPLANEDGGTSGYLYSRQDGQDIRLNTRQVMELKRSDPHSPYETQSLLESLAFEVAGDRFASQYRRNAFESGRPPMVALSTDQDLTTEQATAHGESFKSKFMDQRGNVQGIPVLPNGLSLEDISLDPESFQMLEAQGLDQKVIHKVCQVPEPLLEMDSNRAESEEARRHFMGATIQDLLTEAAAQLTEGLREAFEPEGNLRVIAPNVQPTDKREQAETDRILVESGLRTRNEIRERDDLEPYDTDAAGEPTVPQGQTPLSQAGGPLEALGQSSVDPDDEVADFL